MPERTARTDTFHGRVFGQPRIAACATIEIPEKHCPHDVRDVTLGEDGCRVRKSTAAQVLAAVRNAVIHLLAGVDASRSAAAIHHLNTHPEEALALLDLPQL